MDFYDTHAHIIENQKGGLIIALEGEPVYDNVYDNSEVHVICKNTAFLPVEYVGKSFHPTTTKIIKYHPRREGYSKDEIISDIKKREAKIVIIDTLYNPYFHYSDYWEIIRSAKEKFFILPHCGGYDIEDFIKIVDFNTNVYTDFSLTQEYLGVVTGAPYPKIQETMEYMLGNKKMNTRILFGSDNPFYSQQYALEYYKSKNMIELLNNNFENLLHQANLQTGFIP